MPRPFPPFASSSHTVRRSHRQAVHGVNLTPDYTREGGSIPITLTIEQALDGENVLLLPMGRSDDGAHSLREKLDRDNYFKGTKVYGTYLYELAKQVAS
ncbi:hypothetical protein PAXINDRAFT_102029 [Paxillus involutus ATCC 200175]|uniref:Uncharacterized protein n=1 Tax=Paxillus involutus ATCC 200175 TaxID=664439 RepID=A0A0C9TSZ2_PAXIN|nr:hypothetical protein PAXINDRAFT_102029 [Paxillus involutus ATCC 200175]